MFEEICLVCGKYLQEDGQAYCSEDCQSLDTSSPSISSASSALSSPNLGYAVGGDVPALVPSVLGSALHKYTHRSREYYVSSSSASSTSWSALTDEEDNDVAVGITGEYSFHDSGDSLYEGSSKSPNFTYSMRPSALSYTRRPSGINNHSTVPHLHKRTSSGHVHEIPRSAPLQSHLSTDDDGAYSDFGLSSRDESDADVQSSKDASTSSRSKRTRNRASLPAYFSLLQMSNPSDDKRSSPVSSSSGNTIARRSPPTPKVPLAGLSHASLVSHATPRGRRRAPGEVPDGGRSISSSKSRSRPRNALPDFSPRPFRERLDSKASIEKVLDWSSAPGLARGRATIRRSSSPTPKMILSAIPLEDHSRAVVSGNRVDAHFPRKARGRAKAEEFDEEAPGFGNGRSGLLDRERIMSGRSARLL
ncbi:hypothetical protein BDZ94DRAFT_368359 [Collybia nuda]|uniref:Uncharacterized protein n=1 Tax=Collybia nuda TaxID=64659 RepID=A0A9P5YIG5_9AGAR|nr:hypothetical protein BDZ94DRAFT_368359 [Collybia nuda]